MIFGVGMCKDEEDIAPHIIRHLLEEGLDHLIVMDNGSTDHTLDHLNDFIAHGAPITLLHDPEPGYYQAKRTNQMIRMAGRMGATWIVPFDFDEWWFSPHGRLCEVLTDRIEPVQWVEGYYHIPHPDDDPDEEDPTKRIKHRRQGRDCPQSKVCFRYHPGAEIHAGNHDVDDHPGERGMGLVAFREFQYRSYEHFVRKVRNGKAAYDAAPDLHPQLGIHWRRLGGLTDAELEVEWKDYLATPTVYDPCTPTPSAS